VSNKYTAQEFADKVEWEGGLYEAVTGYGLKASDLDDDAPPGLMSLLEEFQEHAENAAAVEEQINRIFDELRE
jgi:hypothetical protein